jgi:hypothetical protein
MFRRLLSHILSRPATGYICLGCSKPLRQGYVVLEGPPDAEYEEWYCSSCYDPSWGDGVWRDFTRPSFRW